MDEQQLRALVRDAIARQHGAVRPSPTTAPPSPRPSSHATRIPAVPLGPSVHPSVARFHILRPAGETACIIEPAVVCNHCGHCECFGH